MTHSAIFAVAARLLRGETITFHDSAERAYFATADSILWLGAGRGATVFEGDAFEVARRVANTQKRTAASPEGPAAAATNQSRK